MFHFHLTVKAYNLGWKLSQVVHGYADPIILKTYQSERRHIAQQLIDFDTRFSKLFSGKPAKSIMDGEGIDLKEFRKAFEKGNMFTSGIGMYPVDDSFRVKLINI